MTYVPAYVTVVTAAAALVGALASPLVIAFREGRQAKRERLDRSATERRRACLDLLDAAQRLRTQVAGNVDYHGEETRARLEAARELAALVQLNAVAVALLLPDKVSVAGQDLAAAAAELMAAVEDNTSLEQQAMIRPPDFGPIKTKIEELRKSVLADRSH